MKRVLAIVAILLNTLWTFPQQPPKSVTVPVTLDHNRIVIDVYLPLSDGSSKRVRAWVITGSPDLMMSRRIASLFGSLTCQDQVCTATPPRDLVIGGMTISLATIHDAQVPTGLPDDVMVPGMGPEITLPSTVLHEHDVLVDYANREFTIGEPGSIRFKGTATKAQINSSGLIQIASKIEGQNCNLALDTGASTSLISSELVSRWHAAHPSWPFMSGTVGFANMFGTPEEAEGSVLQLPALRYGENPLSKVAVASFSLTRTLHPHKHQLRNFFNRHA